MTDWQEKAKNLKASSSDPEIGDYFAANREMARRTLTGKGPHPSSAAEGGLRVAYNLPARVAVDFLDTLSGKPGHGRYLNRTDLARIHGKPLTGETIRERIDAALAKVSAGQEGGTLTATNGYYGAMELNGTGIRYFGDICLVLKPKAVAASTLTLLRNSYDLCVAPVGTTLAGLDRADQDRRAAEIAAGWAGQWEKDAVEIALVKILRHAAPTVRRMTTAQVSDGVLADEDYIEIVRDRGFTPGDVEEIRLTAGDAALEAWLADRARVGAAPSASQWLWRFRRRCIDHAAERAGLPLRTVTTTGRART